MSKHTPIFTTSYLLLITYLFLLATACQETATVFKKIDSAHSNLTFVNEITETATLNILESEFVYNGAGVAIGDMNGDGQPDLFFTGNQVDNQLYLNKGGLQFENSTAIAGIEKPDTNNWSSGVNLVDLNRDGKLDIYVCNTLQKNPNHRKNLLYINQGNNSQGIPLFKEMAAAYGIADTSHSSHAQFFDYDNDGDLDLFVGVNWILERYPNDFEEKKLDGTDPNRDNLFQNNWDATLGHPVFTDVSLAAGLVQDGYSHSTLINDFNEDGWLDIYVANDYQSDDLIFINQQDGTFKNEAGRIFKHFSLSAMGSDLADINNDGKIDFFTSEMQPYYNKRKKLFQGESNYRRTILTEKFGYEHQYTRNTLQLNLGINPTTSLPVYAEVGLLAQVQETDWSWAALFADYDNDGFQDLFVANGFPKDVTDRDFSDFRSYASKLVAQEDLIAAIPEVKVPNFLFRNKGDLSFENVAKEWGLSDATFSNGAAYGDLDGDGDLDLVVSNIDDPILLFENQSNKTFKEHHYLRIKLTGAAENRDAYGAAAIVYKDNWKQKSYLLSGRGYLSASESIFHFGLGSKTSVDSIQIIWPGGFLQTIGTTQADQVLELTFAPKNNTAINKGIAHQKTIFKEVSTDYQLNYLHPEIDFIDFSIQRTLPHKFSQSGPPMSVGDVNKDGLEDLFIGSSRKFKQSWFLQQKNGQFQQQEVSYKRSVEDMEEDAATLLFDADKDGDLDLYLGRGSGQYPPQDSLYRDVLLMNDGLGNFSENRAALPTINTNSSCVKAADFDQDGDLDLFIGSRVLPYNYPKGDYSYILRNDSEKGQPKFVDITADIIPDLGSTSLITDALWTDFNGDSLPDLIVTSEWSAIRFFENTNGQLVEITDKTGLANYKGWWTSLAAADFDKDGDMDYVAGNFGENTFFQCKEEEPLRIYGKDLDKNGSIDPLISCYWKDSLGTKKEYFYHPLQDVIKQFVGIRKKIHSFGAYGEATVSDILSKEDLKDALVFSANWMKTSWIENKGNNQFELHALPLEAQFAPIYSLLPIDLNKDQFMDILLVGNDFGMEVQQGRADAFAGLALQNDGQGNFIPLPLNQSHFYVPGDAKSLVLLRDKEDRALIIAGQNQDSLKVFAFKEAEIIQ